VWASFQIGGVFFTNIVSVSIPPKKERIFPFRFSIDAFITALSLSIGDGGGMAVDVQDDSFSLLELLDESGFFFHSFSLILESFLIRELLFEGLFVCSLSVIHSSKNSGFSTSFAFPSQ